MTRPNLQNQGKNPSNLPLSWVHVLRVGMRVRFHVLVVAKRAARVVCVVVALSARARQDDVLTQPGVARTHAGARVLLAVDLGL